MPTKPGLGSKVLVRRLVDAPRGRLKYAADLSMMCRLITRGHWNALQRCGGRSRKPRSHRPRAVPTPDDPVVAKLCKRAGKGWFREVSLPRAQVALRQGAGRLMRRPDDRGVVALLDPRIRTRGWGKSVLSALPQSHLRPLRARWRTCDATSEPEAIVGRRKRIPPPTSNSIPFYTASWRR